MKQLFKFCVLILLPIITLAIVYCSAASKSVPKQQFKSKSSDYYNWPLKTLDGKSFNLSDTKNKVVFLNIWETWCPPCRAEMPSIQSLFDKTKDRVVFICVSGEDPNTVQQFITENHYTFPVYLSPYGVPEIFYTNAIPRTYIIKKNGSIVYTQIGRKEWDTPEVLALLDKLVKE